MGCPLKVPHQRKLTNYSRSHLLLLSCPYHHKVSALPLGLVPGWDLLKNVMELAWESSLARHSDGKLKVEREIAWAELLKTE